MPTAVPVHRITIANFSFFQIDVRKQIVIAKLITKIVRVHV